MHVALPVSKVQPCSLRASHSLCSVTAVQSAVCAVAEPNPTVLWQMAVAVSTRLLGRGWRPREPIMPSKETGGESPTYRQRQGTRQWH